MFRRPQFKAHLRVEVVAPDRVLLYSETGHTTLEGRLNALLAPWLNGQNSPEEIADRLEEQLTPLDVQYGLEQLEENGLLVEADGAGPPELGVVRDAWNVAPKSFADRLRTTLVSVQSLGGVSSALLRSALHSLHLKLADDGAFTIVLTDEYLRGELSEINQRAMERKKPWMAVKPVGSVLWIGPIFDAPRTPCWECLAKRLRERRALEISLDHEPATGGGNSAPPLATLPSTFSTGVNLAATEAFRWVSRGENELLGGKLLTLDVNSLQLESHSVARQRNCPACGKPSEPRQACPAPLRLASRKKVYIADGGHRSVPPEETFQKLSHLISPLTGIVDGVERHSGAGSEPAQVYAAKYIFPVQQSAALRAKGGGTRTSAGKGMSAAQARTSALCEAIERYSGIFQGDELRLRASYRALGDKAIHPNACMNFSARQYERRARWNARESQTNWVPEPFDESREIEWTPAWSLIEQIYKYVPTAYCFYGYPAEAGHDFCRAHSNGSAAGNNAEEAIVQGFLELVERDGVALWWYNRARRPGVNLASFPQPYFRELDQHYRRVGRAFHVLDITSDFEIPTFAAISLENDPSQNNLALGFGAHFDATLAIARALTEMNQFLHPAGKPRRVFENELDNDAFLKPVAAAAQRTFEDYGRAGDDDILAEVQACARLAAERGLEVLVVDQSRGEVGLSVMKVIAPGMRSFWARFGPGRLYEVPVKLGWQAAPLSEDELNAAHLSI